MGTGWRRAFCSTLPRDSSRSRSTPSTPRLRCKTKNVESSSNESNSLNPKLDSIKRFASNPSSPRSPFSILKNTLALALSRNNSCGVCMQSLNKSGHGTAIYTAECSHTFHFPCIAAHVQNHTSLFCPVCAALWIDAPLLLNKNQQQEEVKIVQIDEPLLTPRFNPIPKFAIDEEEEEVQEFLGFVVNPVSSIDDNDSRTTVKVSILPDAAVISQSRSHSTYAVVLKVKAPPHVPETAKRAPIDVVTVLDVSGSMAGAKLEMLKRAMRLVIASLGSADRLSILAFSAAPRRLLPLRRMTPQGQRSARRIIDSLGCSHGSSMAEALREATRILEERRERNPVASIILLSDGGAAAGESNQRCGSSSHSTRFSHIEIPVHLPSENAFSECVSGLLSVVVQDVRIQVGFAAGSDPGEVMAIYSCNERPAILGSGCIRLGDLYAEEEKECLIEIRVPASRVGYGSNHVLSVTCCYKEPGSQKVVVYGKDEAVVVPTPAQSVGCQRLRNVFITSRAVAESRRLVEHNELSSAMQLLSSARALLAQSSTESAGEYISGLEAELAEVQMAFRRRREMIGEPLTPTSAWRGATGEKMAKVAQIQKSFYRINDLHGFENARF